MMNIMKKDIIIATAVAGILMLAIIFRDQIKTLALGNKGQEASPIPSFSFPSAPSVSPSSSLLPKAASLPSSSKHSVYQGRPPEEVRPVPDEVKLFSDSQKKDIYNSIRDYGKSVRENPDFFDSWIQLGLLKKTIGDYEGTRDAWEYASVIRPLNSLSFRNLGELYWRYLRLYTQAEANFKISIKHDPHDPGTYVSLSDVYFYSLKEKSHLADDILLQGLAVNPQSMDLTKALARLYEKSGQYANAIEWWQKVLANDPRNTAIIELIGKLKKKLSGQ